MKAILVFIAVLFVSLGMAQKKNVSTIWQKGHFGKVSALALSSNNELMLSGGDDGTIILWDIKTATQLMRIESGGGAVVSLLFSPNDKLFESLTETGNLYYRKTSNGEVLGITTIDSTENTSFFPLSTRGVGSDFWELSYDQKIGEDSLLQKNIGLSATGKLIAYIGDKKRLLVWDAKAKKRYKKLKLDDAEISSLKFSPNGRYLATLSKDNNIKIWNLRKSEIIDSIQLKVNGYSSIQFTADSRKLNIISEISTIKTNNYHTYIDQTESLFVIYNFIKHTTEQADTASLILNYNPSTKLIASMQTDMKNNVLLVCDFNDQLKHLLRFDAENIVSTAFSDDGRYIVTAGEYGSIAVYDVKKKEQQFLFQIPGAQIKSLNMSDDGKYLAVHFAGIDVENINNNRNERLNDIIQKKMGENVRLWSVDSLRYEHSIYTGDAAIGSISFNNNELCVIDEYFNSYTLDCTDLSKSIDPEVIQLPLCDILRKQQSMNEKIFFSTDGNFIIKKDKDKYRLRDVRKRKELMSISDVVLPPVFSTNNQWLFTIGRKGCIKKIDMRFLEKYIVLDSVPAVEKNYFSDAGKYFVVRAKNQTRLYDTELDSEKIYIDILIDNDLCFKNNDQFYCTAHNDSVYLYNTAKQAQLVAVSKNDCLGLSHICITPDEKYIYISDGSTIKIIALGKELKQELFTTYNGSIQLKTISNTKTEAPNTR